MTYTASPTSGLQEPIPGLPPDDVIFGSSPAMGNIRQKLEKTAGANIAVLLRGQSGTEKEVLAKLIHSQSPWRNGPFVKASCPAIPGTLIESELFGYEKGAFTGAYGVAARPRIRINSGASSIRREVACKTNACPDSRICGCPN